MVAFAAPDASITGKIPDGLTIEGTAVTGYSGDATELTVPNGVTEIGKNAFNGNTTIESLILPESVKKISGQAFWGATNLKNLTMPGVTTIAGSEDEGYQIFINSGIEHLDMPEVITVGDRAFFNATELTSVTMQKVETIGDEAFSGTKLANVVIPDTVKKIGAKFLYSVHPKTVTISLDTLMNAEIDENAFGNAFLTYEPTTIILTGVENEDVTLLTNGIEVGDTEKIFSGGGGLYIDDFHVAVVQDATGGTITNQTGQDVTVNGQTIANNATVTVGSETEASLGSLSLGDLSITPAFQSDIYNYNATVSDAVDTVSVTATPAASGATMTINGTAATGTVSVPLVVGNNSITIVVTAPDGVTKQTYVVNVEREEAPGNLDISTPDELMAFAHAVNEGKYSGLTNVTVRLTDDINMTGYDWTPIGDTGERYFSGTFDGQGHTIEGLVLNTAKSDFVGLFGATTATIENVKVAGTFDATGTSNSNGIGTIAGYSVGGTISHCQSDFSLDSEVPQGQAIGGIVGQKSGGTIKNCVSNTNMTLNPLFYVGGIVGYVSNAAVENCINNGKITTIGNTYIIIGGIAGTAMTGAKISYCENNGAIDATTRTSTSNSEVGGIIGKLQGATVSHSTNYADISGRFNQVGGIGGAFSSSENTIDNCLNMGSITNMGTSSSCKTGGILGNGYSGKSVMNCISACDVNAESGTQYGPIVGSAGNTIFSNNHYHVSIPSSSDPEDIGGTSHDDMNTQTVIDEINAGGGDYVLDENGQIIVRPLTYTLTVEGSEAENNGSGTYTEGTEVAVDAGTRDGYTFAGWTSTAGRFADASVAQTVFTMPDQDVTITANWEKIKEPPYTGKYSYEVFTDIGENGTLTVDRYATEGDTVTIAITPDRAYKLDDLSVTANGKDVELTANGDGTYSFTMPSADVKITATFAEDPDWIEPEPEEPSTDVSDIFIDVAPNAWYTAAIQYAYDNGLMTGVSANEFAPDATTTRGMIVSMLARLEGVESANDAGFADVEGEWYATAVNWAASVGVVSGYEDNTFRPNDAITREQLAAILMNYAAYKGEDVSARADLSAYTDQPSAWAEETMSWAVAEGLITGVTNNELQPQGNATRAQVAAILQRFLGA